MNAAAYCKSSTCYLALDYKWVWHVTLMPASLPAVTIVPGSMYMPHDLMRTSIFQTCTQNRWYDKEHIEQCINCLLSLQEAWSKTSTWVHFAFINTCHLIWKLYNTLRMDVMSLPILCKVGLKRELLSVQGENTCATTKWDGLNTGVHVETRNVTSILDVG